MIQFRNTAPGASRKAVLSASILPWLAALYLAAPALAQNAAPSPVATGTATTSGTNASTLLNEVVVTATRTDETAASVTSAYTKIDDQEIQRAQIPTVKQAVDLSPGVATREQGAEGGTTAVSIRGNRSVDTLFLVDGIKADSVLFGNGGSPLMSFASTYNLEAVEVVRGPHSSLFGTDAIGGVVAMETKRGSGTPTTTAFFEGGSHSSFKEGLISGGSLGALDYSFHYARQDTSNDRANNDLGVNSASLRLDYTVSDQLTLGLAVRTQQADYQEPGSVRNIDVGFNDPNKSTDQEATSVSTYAELKVNDSWTSKLTLGVYRERYVYDDPFNPASYLGTYQAIHWQPYDWTWTNPFDGYMLPASADYSNTQDHAVTESANWLADWKNTIELAENNRLVAGASILYQTGHYEDGSHYTLSNPYTYDSYYNQVSYGSSMDIGTYIEDQWEIVKNLTLAGSVRYDHNQLNGNGSKTNVNTYGSSLYRTPYDVDADVVTYRLGAAYLVEQTRTKLHASFGTGFKEPTVYQLNTSSYANGDTLDPEESKSWDVGVDQYFLGDKLVLGATFFHSNIDNLITYLSQPSPKQSYYINSDEANAHGIEAGATAKLTDRWQARLAYTWTESEQSKYCWNSINDVNLTGMQRALRIPRHVVTADTNYTFDLPVGKLTLGAGLSWVAQREDVDWGYADGKPVIIKGQTAYAGRVVDLDDYVTARIYARYDLNARWAFTARVENLTNEDYEPVLGYPALGRTYYGGVQVTF